MLASEIVMPRLSDSMEEGTIARWLVAVGDAVTPGDPLLEVETDKATVTYESEHAGTILLLAAAEGQSVAVGAVIAAVGVPEEAVDTGNGGVVGAAPANTRVKASPLARRFAAQLGVDLATVSGTGPHGRVIRADVELQAGGARRDRTVRELSRLQQTIARRMAESRSTVPDFELRRELDMTAVVDLRAQLREIEREQLRELGGPLPSYNDFIVRACALALRAFPRVNGSYRDGSVETHDHINIGIAVAAEDALVVPTIVDADRKSLAEIAACSRELAEKVRAGTVSPAELDGGTFTVSNLGMYGVDSFSAVINPPQAAILAVGALKPRPVVADDGVTLVARPTLHVSLACDHRILYGADGARFLDRIAQLLASPLALLV
ncbi:MAG: 2-oxo acid dehydrogenase subunit E2 [Acidobacteriota bacterium]|nr:2-oxo acid dehydrogenase subunit E2 [Acidobacteriota bacterium]